VCVCVHVRVWGGGRRVYGYTNSMNIPIIIFQRDCNEHPCFLRKLEFTAFLTSVETSITLTISSVEAYHTRCVRRHA